VTVAADSFRMGLGCWLDRVAAGEDAVVTRRGKPMIRLTAAAPVSASASPSSAAPPPLALIPTAAVGSA